MLGSLVGAYLLAVQVRAELAGGGADDLLCTDCRVVHGQGHQVIGNGGVVLRA